MRTDAIAGQTAATFWTIFGSLVLALLYALIMLVVMVAILATLVYRIVMLWIYIILSPLAYLSSVVPFMQGIAKNWWRQFFQQLAAGPLLAFFLWLALATLGQFAAGTNQQWAVSMGFQKSDYRGSLTAPTVGITQVGTVDHMLRFIVSLGLLIGGLVVSRSFGGAAGSAAGSAIGVINSGAGWIKRKSVAGLKKGTAAAGQAAWAGTKAAGRGTIGLAKAVDYTASKRLSERGGRPTYAHDQGYLTRGASQIRDLLKQADLVKQFKNMGHLNTQRMAATKAGYHVDANGRKYSLIDSGQHKGRFAYQDANGNLEFWTKKNGKQIKAMGDFSSKFHQSWRSDRAGAAHGAAATDKAKKDLDELKKTFADRSKEELWALASGTTNPERLQGIYAALADKKGGLGSPNGLDQARKNFVTAQNAFAMHPERLNAFLEAAGKNQPELVYDPDKEVDAKAMTLKIRKGQIRLDEAEFDNLKLNGAQNGFDDPQHLPLMSKFLQIFKEALGTERYRNQMNKVNKEGNAQVSQKLSLAAGELAKQSLAANDGERAYNYYKDQLIMDNNSDIRNFARDASGHVDQELLRRFFSTASTAELSEIDSSTMDTEAQQAAMGISYKRLDSLVKSGRNPALARLIAKEMADRNHVNADKIPNIYNDIDVNLPAVEQNRAVDQWIRTTGTTLRQDLLDDFRSHNSTAADFNRQRGNLVITNNAQRLGQLAAALQNYKAAHP